MLTALRAFACGTCLQYSRRDGDGKETDNSQNQSYRGVTSILIRIVYHTAVKAGAYGTYACHHTRIPVAVFQVRNHVSCLNTFADGIGQVSFQTVSGIKLDAALVGYQQDNQSVIFALLAHTPFVEQSVREVKTVLVADGRYDGYHGFNTGLLLQCIKNTVYFIACRSGEYAGRVANVTCLVLKMYFRNVLGSVNFLCLQGNEHAQEKCYGDKSFHTIVFVEAKIGKITSMDVFPYKFLYALRIFLRIIPVRHGVCRPGYNPQLFRFALGLVQGIDHPSGHVCIRISMYE